MANDDKRGTLHPMGVDGYGTGRRVDHSRGVAVGETGRDGRHTGAAEVPPQQS